MPQARSQRSSSALPIPLPFGCCGSGRTRRLGLRHWVSAGYGPQRGLAVSGGALVAWDRARRCCSLGSARCGTCRGSWLVAGAGDVPSWWVPPPKLGGRSRSIVQVVQGGGARGSCPHPEEGTCWWLQEAGAGLVGAGSGRDLQANLERAHFPMFSWQGTGGSGLVLQQRLGFP